MKRLRGNVGIAIDGGGIKGLIIARALIALEKKLECQRLIDCPNIKILAGTSTGSILSAGIALGLDAGSIAQIYRRVGQTVFPRLTPGWFPGPLRRFAEGALAVCRHSLYSNRKLIEVLKDTIEKQTGNADWTLENVQDRIGPDKVLILTVVDITERRTHFLKSDDAGDQQWKLWEAVLVSASAPPALPVWPRREHGSTAYYTDGGVGSYGNPAYIVAQEAAVFRGYDPAEVSLLSFGTGWQNAANFEKYGGAPTGWRGLDWAQNGAFIVAADAIRAQSLDILDNPKTLAMDFRRFQFELEQDIAAENYGDDATYTLMEKLGDDLGLRIVGDQYASPGCPPQFDPEGLFARYTEYKKAKRPQAKRPKAKRP